MAKKKEETEFLLVEQIGSPIRRNRIQKEYLKSLGLGKMHKTRKLKKTPEVLGLLNKAHHLVRIVEQK